MVIDARRDLNINISMVECRNIRTHRITMHMRYEQPYMDMSSVMIMVMVVVVVAQSRNAVMHIRNTAAVAANIKLQKWFLCGDF